VYRINGSQLEKSSNGGSTFVGITAPEVTIESFNFYVTGAEIAGDNSQPRVVMILQGSAGVSDKIKTNFNIQATVSQRLLDL
jgi:hypothetical protein